MEKPDVTHRGDSDSSPNPSLEKGSQRTPGKVIAQQVPDPDAHLSPEERARIVGSVPYPTLEMLLIFDLGSHTPLET